MGADNQGGYLENPAEKNKVITCVDTAIAAGIYVVIRPVPPVRIDPHCAHGHSANVISSRSCSLKKMRTHVCHTSIIIIIIIIIST